MEDIIEEAAQQQEEESQESSHEKRSHKKRPKKRRKKSHHSGDESNEPINFDEIPKPIYLKPDDPRMPYALEKEQLEIEKEELKTILTNYPDLDVSQQLKLATELDSMNKEQLHRLYKAAKHQMMIQCPHHDAENLVVLVSQLLYRWTKNPSIVNKVRQDTRLRAAVNTFLPEFGTKFSAPLECVGRLVGHWWDAMYPDPQ